MIGPSSIASATAGSNHVMSDGTPTTSVPPEGSAAGGGWTLTHTLPSATTSACGLPPTATCAVGRLVRSSMRVSVPSPAFATQTLPSPSRDRRGRAPDLDRRHHGARRGIDRLDRSVESIGDPDGAPADRHRGRPTPDRDRGDRTGRIDADDEVRLAVGEPRAPEALRDRSRRDIRVDPAQRPPAPSVDPCQVPGARRDDDRVPAPR